VTGRTFFSNGCAFCGQYFRTSPPSPAEIWGSRIFLVDNGAMATLNARRARSDNQNN
jgi:hypothetical protein